jgi:lysophospholipase L1-like esterase
VTLLLYPLCAFVGVCVAELAARAWIRMDNRYYVLPPRTRSEIILDSVTHPQLPPHVRFEVNSDGERGDEFVPHPGTVRILVAGGSSTECYFLDQDVAWPSLVGSYLSESKALSSMGAAHVHVGSIGSAGVHSGALSLMLRRVLPRYRRLDVLILMVGVGDVLRWFCEDTPADGKLRILFDDYFARHPGKKLGLTPRSSALAAVTRRVRDRWFVRVKRHEHAGRWVGRARAMRASAAEIRDHTPDTAALIATYECNLRDLIRHARETVPQILIVKQPWFDKESYTPEERRLFWLGGVGEAWFEHVSVFYSERALSRVMRQIDACTERVSEECGVACLEMRSKVPSNSAHYYDEVHFTAEGSRAVARAVADGVLRMMESTDT